MNYFPVVNMLQSQASLCEDVKNLVLLQVATLCIFDQGPNIASICILHDNTKVCVLWGGIDLSELNDVGVRQLF